MNRDLLIARILTKIVMGLVCLALLYGTGAPPWAFVLFLALTVDWR